MATRAADLILEGGNADGRAVCDHLPSDVDPPHWRAGGTCRLSPLQQRLKVLLQIRCVLFRVCPSTPRSVFARASVCPSASSMSMCWASVECSYGFRPGRSAHQALEVLWHEAVCRAGGWVLEIDIRKFFDTLDHGHLRTLLRRRIRDGVLLRLIGKWLKRRGPGGRGVVAPRRRDTARRGHFPAAGECLPARGADEWFERDVKPRLKGRGFLVRYADDAVLLFSREEDARRVMEVLPKRSVSTA